MGAPVILTSTGRTFGEHINLYKKVYGDDWEDKLTVDSRHLPSWKTNFLRAVDFKVIKKDGTLYTGDEIKDEITNASNKLTWVNIGIGVAKFWCHLDIDRTKRETIWYY